MSPFNLMSFGRGDGGRLEIGPISPTGQAPGRRGGDRGIPGKAGGHPPRAESRGRGRRFPARRVLPGGKEGQLRRSPEGGRTRLSPGFGTTRNHHARQRHDSLRRADELLHLPRHRAPGRCWPRSIILASYYLGFRAKRAVLLPFIVVVFGTVWAVGAHGDARLFHHPHQHRGPAADHDLRQRVQHLRHERVLPPRGKGAPRPRPPAGGAPAAARRPRVDRRGGHQHGPTDPARLHHDDHRFSQPVGHRHPPDAGVRAHRERRLPRLRLSRAVLPPRHARVDPRPARGKDAQAAGRPALPRHVPPGRPGRAPARSHPRCRSP